LLAVVAVIQDKLLKNDRVRLQTQNAGYRNRILESKKQLYIDYATSQENIR
jgi:hypothetical protein